MKSGFVALIGRPNAGKSTLLNHLLNQKVSIVSSKPQTTRNAIQGVLNLEDAQIVFVDTPGVHKPYFRLGEYMNDVAFSSTKDVEVIVYLIDASLDFKENDQYLLDRVKKFSSPVIVAFNKIDLSNVKRMEALKKKYQEELPEARQVELSALEPFNLDELIQCILSYLEEGPQFFPEGMVSDHDDKFLAEEIIREKILHFTQKEVPHSVAVKVDVLERGEDGIEIDATIIVERSSQKGIIIGKQGTMIHKIGVAARREMEKMWKQHVVLNTFVKVEKDWRNSEKDLKELGYKKS